jgi:hypothetical protein
MAKIEFPNMKFSPQITNSYKYECDDIIQISKGSSVFSINLQATVTFSEDILVLVTNRCIMTPNYFFGKIIEKRFIFIEAENPTYFVESRSGDIGFLVSDNDKLFYSKERHLTQKEKYGGI